MSNELARQTQTMPAWITAMRAAAQSAISESDIKEIVEAQLKRAKSGDSAAIKFIFDQVIGMKGMTLIQNNFPADPDEPTSAKRGTPDKVSVMARRAAAGLPLTCEADGGRDNLD